ncbi:MAG: hypothetical protein A2W09_08250 [Deltaproteobacteria bacterium RBG_16_50_11]|nr:MAG: hypothetical protein A2W09_08250 [Deltaproteobacteria bacterium RBG_16_50_11]
MPLGFGQMASGQKGNTKSEKDADEEGEPFPQQKTQPFNWVSFFAARFRQGTSALWFFLP